MESAQENQKEKNKCLKMMGEWAKSYNIPTKCIYAIEKSFADIDLDDSGDASVQELRVAMKFTDMITHEGGVESLMREIDVNGDGTVDLYEFGLYVMNQMASLAGSQKRFHPQDPESGLGMRKPSFTPNGTPIPSSSPRRPTGNGLAPIEEKDPNPDKQNGKTRVRSRPRSAHKSTPPARSPAAFGRGGDERTLQDIEMKFEDSGHHSIRSASTGRVDEPVSSRQNERAFADERGMSLPRDSTANTKANRQGRTRGRTGGF